MCDPKLNGKIFEPLACLPDNFLVLSKVEQEKEAKMLSNFVGKVK